MGEVGQEGQAYQLQITIPDPASLWESPTVLGPASHLFYLTKLCD